jgi:hypothetical protein
MLGKGVLGGSMAIEGFDEWAWVIGTPIGVAVGLYIWRRRPPWWEPVENRWNEWPARFKDWYQAAQRNLSSTAFKGLRLTFWVGLAAIGVLGVVSFLNEIDMTVEERRRLTLFSITPLGLVLLALIGADSAANRGRKSKWLIVSWVAPFIAVIATSVIEWYDTAHAMSNSEGVVRALAYGLPAAAFFFARARHRRIAERQDSAAAST